MAVSLLDVNVLIALPALAVPLVVSLTQHPTHQFWPDDLSLLDGTFVDPARLLDAGLLTDTYLLVPRERQLARQRLHQKRSGEILTTDMAFPLNARQGADGGPHQFVQGH